MIHRTRFIKKAVDLGMIRYGNDMCWDHPAQFVLWWDVEDESVHILPNTQDVKHSRAQFTEPDELDAAFATYRLMNQGG